jgi:hypothetical protein
VTITALWNAGRRACGGLAMTAPLRAVAIKPPVREIALLNPKPSRYGGIDRGQHGGGQWRNGPAMPRAISTRPGATPSQ